MFFIIPFGIFLISTVAIVSIVGRKFVYLKKLNPEVVESVMPERDSFLMEIFPGLAFYFQASKFREYRLNFLAESEKLLRKFRLFSLRLDSAVNQLINMIRRSVTHHESIINNEAVIQAEQEIKISNSDTSNGNGWKEEEHKLIFEIATNPKDPELYKKLGNVYMKMGDWRDAAESFKKALEFNPDDETVRNKLARAIQKLEKLPV